MLDEEKTKQELIAELTSLRLKRSVWEKQEDKGMMSDQTLHEALEWKDFLLGLYERSFDLSDEALYGYVLDFVVQLTGSLVGFCHLVAEDQKSIVLTTWTNEALKNCAAVYNTHYPVDQAGNWVDCLRLQRPVVYNEFSEPPNRKGLPAGHNPIRRFLSVPVVERGKVRMILGVGNKTDAYTEQDVFQTEMVAHNLQNILARRHADQQLREREERLSLALKTTQDAIWDWNIPQGNGYASPSYYTMLGYDHDSISLNSDAWWSLIHPDDLKKVREAINLVMQSQFTSQDDVPASEFRMKTNTGGWRWILARGKVVEWDGEGYPVRMVGTHTDITERKQAEEGLRQREAMLRSVFKATPVGLCIMKDRVYLSANKAWYDTFGYAETDIIGYTTRMLYENEDEYERVGRELVAGLSESGFVSIRTRLQRKDGVFREATVTAAPLHPEDISSGMVVTI